MEGIPSAWENGAFMKQKNKIVEVYGIWFLDLVSILVSFIVGTYIRFGRPECAFFGLPLPHAFLYDIQFLF